jgi:hypothetical protein
VAEKEEGISTDESESTATPHSSSNVLKKTRDKKKDTKETLRDRAQWEKELAERYVLHFFFFFLIWKASIFLTVSENKLHLLEKIELSKVESEKSRIAEEREKLEEQKAEFALVKKKFDEVEAEFRKEKEVVRLLSRFCSNWILCSFLV